MADEVEIVVPPEQCSEQDTAGTGTAYLPVAHAKRVKTHHSIYSKEPSSVDMTALWVLYEPSDNDVIFASTSLEEAARHTGNLRFLRTAKLRLERYCDAPTAFEKAAVVSDIVKIIESSGGCFLIKKRDRWFKLNKFYACKEVHDFLLDLQESKERSNDTKNRADLLHDNNFEASSVAAFLENTRVQSGTAAPTGNTNNFEIDYGYEDEETAVMQVALHNYEAFYGLVHGSATIDVLRTTSAGIWGWASSVIDDSMSLQKTKKAQNYSSEESTKMSSQRAGDQEESLALQQALLKSMGVTIPPKDSCDNDDDDDVDGSDCYRYASDEESEGDWSNEDAELNNVTTAEVDTKKIKGRRKIMTTSWQFQQLRSQIEQSNSGNSNPKAQMDHKRRASGLNAVENDQVSKVPAKVSGDIPPDNADVTLPSACDFPLVSDKGTKAKEQELSDLASAPLNQAFSAMGPKAPLEEPQIAEDTTSISSADNSWTEINPEKSTVSPKEASLDSESSDDGETYIMLPCNEAGSDGEWSHVSASDIINGDD